MKLRFVFAVLCIFLSVGWAVNVRAGEGEDFLKDKTLTNSGACSVSFPPAVKIIVPCERYVGKDGRVYIALFHPYSGKMVAIKEMNEKTGEQKNVWAPPLEV